MPTFFVRRCDALLALAGVVKLKFRRTREATRTFRPPVHPTALLLVVFKVVREPRPGLLPFACQGRGNLPGTNPTLRGIQGVVLHPA